jgi:hypothetical protein
LWPWDGCCWGFLGFVCAAVLGMCEMAGMCCEWWVVAMDGWDVWVGWMVRCVVSGGWWLWMGGMCGLMGVARRKCGWDELCVLRGLWMLF